MFNGAIISLPPGQLKQLQQSPSVLWVEEDRAVTKQTTVSPVDSWGLDRIDQRALPLNSSYSYDTTGAGVDAYIVDTGILPTHSQFGSRVRAGFKAFGGIRVFGLKKGRYTVRVRAVNTVGDGLFSSSATAQNRPATVRRVGRVGRCC
ncbi:MAG: hypothetical protein ACKOQ1_09790 [Actinomycetota bacterium]